METKKLKNNLPFVRGLRVDSVLRARIKRTLSNKLTYIVIPAFLLSLVWFLWVVWYKVVPHEVKKVHYHAGFMVINNNQQENFSDLKYMKIEPCRKDDSIHNESEEDEQLEKAHLHENVGDVVHIEREGVRWKDLFKNLKYNLDYAKAEAYVNGKKVFNFQNRQIEPYDSLIVFTGVGNDFNKFIPLAVTKTHIQEAESKSEDCGNH